MKRGNLIIIPDENQILNPIFKEDMKEKDIQRINELYNLDKSIGLTPEQKEEQRKLRHEYIQSVRANLRAQLNNVSIKNEDGSITPLKPKGLN